MIESKEALDEIEGILAVPGLDGVVVGRSDLSYSLGVERNDPLVTQAQHRIAKVARAAGVGLMNIIYSPEELGPWLEMPEGPRVFWYATDTFQIGTWFQSLVRHSREIVASHGASRTPEA
jgi:2-keto-3-deoxy-L-rhamnonate aldolase RhmA